MHIRTMNGSLDDGSRQGLFVYAGSRFRADMLNIGAAFKCCLQFGHHTQMQYVASIMFLMQLPATAIRDIV